MIELFEKFDHGVKFHEHHKDLKCHPPPKKKGVCCRHTDFRTYVWYLKCLFLASTGHQTSSLCIPLGGIQCVTSVCLSLMTCPVWLHVPAIFSRATQVKAPYRTSTMASTGHSYKASTALLQVDHEGMYM